MAKDEHASRGGDRRDRDLVEDALDGSRRRRQATLIDQDDEDGEPHPPAQGGRQRERGEPVQHGLDGQQ